MGIKLDWEVESEGGWNEVGEDPKAIEARRRRARRIRNILLVILAVLLVVAGAIAYRLYRVGQQVREALRATVAAETLALRIGDKDAYLDVQSRLGGWHQIQELTFQEYQAAGTNVEVTGQIVDMDINANQARVTLREDFGGKLYHVVWFYQRDDSGWKHIAPAPRFWGNQQAYHSTHFNFDYYSEDQVLVDTLNSQLDSWWQTACNLTQCVHKPPPLDVRIEPDPLAEIGWSQYDANTLIIPSPQVGRFQPDGKPDPALISQLADLIAYRWAEHVVGKAIPIYSEADWLRSEIHHWLRYRFDPTQPPAPLLSPLVQNYGKEIVPPLIDHIKRGDPLVPVLQELTGANVADLPVGWELYLTYRLRAERYLMQDGKETEAMLLYRDPERRPFSDTVLDYVVAISDADAIQITGLHRYGELAWAETVFTGFSSQLSQEIPGNTMITFLPFRLLSDRWVRTTPTEADWGPTREERGAHVILRYHDLDTPTAAGLQVSLEQLYDQVVADMGDPADLTGIPVVMLVEIVGYDLNGNVLSFQESGTGEEQSTAHMMLTVQAPSLYSMYHLSKETSQESLRYAVAPHLISALVKHVLSSLPPDHPLSVAFMYRELSHVGFPSAKEGLRRQAYNGQPPEELEDLWSETTSCIECDIIASDILLDVLVEHYGEGTFARLVANLSRASSMDDWLNRSLGIHNTDVEAEWIERVKGVLSGAQ